MKKRNLLFIFGLFMLVAISGCGLLPGNNNGDDNPDANSDDVEDTPVAQVDDSGQAIIATPVPEDTPIPTNTPLPTALSLAVSTTAPLQSPTPDPDCEYGAAFVSDVTIPDGMNVPMGVNFEKTWRVINTGTCTWEKGSTWIFAGGSQMGADASVSVPTAEPGEVVDITVWFISPTTPGTYRSTWHLKLWHGLELDTLFFVEIVVPLVTPTPIRPTATSSGSGGSGATATPGPSPTPITSPSTWVGKYYNNKELSGDPVFTQNDSALNFDWGTGSPSAEVTADNFSASWIRTIDFSVGTYRFYMFSDDGIRAY
ncbi:MAG: hypothetical protein GY943_21400, partial [Chloroflexi bacterium]|nr:hypothetical protein [Chloroflexota bacterium]